ncbi:unnamed protein product (macronuclear) [Paramecium tetraurelia]|uniref:Uncharacterized protein n=1 Tax=Paramecium tetraurelia TaxID=5888 RepID=A0DAB5_PARTE|nr:uncharacterized protein GSPATT00014889001 [Paramecium tetraurelia]CAK79982.1 unnamed protein product [Paramecium tetraurelia]|eukprot:XP_001447379.1 hypothetical protein (macronuclear) [Paramecium tetraurelia strain d4-2]
MATPFFTVKDVPAQDFIHAYAEYLKKNQQDQNSRMGFNCQDRTWKRNFTN